MILPREAWLGLVLFCAGCATTSHLTPEQTPPPLWSGVSGWQADATSMRVFEGTKRAGDAIVEHDVELRRTGVVTETIQTKNLYGMDLIVPAGSKAFATNFKVVRGAQQTPEAIDPIEWCIYLPEGIHSGRSGAETVCTFWESPERARYEQDFQVGGFSFWPSLTAPSGVRAAVPKIQEQPVDFGVQFKRQMRIVEVTSKDLAIETVYSDGTHAKRSDLDRYTWTPDGTRTLYIDGKVVSMTAAPDHKAVTIKLLTGTPQDVSARVEERTVVLELLIGTDGSAKDGRVAISSGSASLDEAALVEAKKNWKVKPALENSQPVEKWTRFSVTLRLVD